ERSMRQILEQSKNESESILPSKPTGNSDQQHRDAESTRTMRRIDDSKFVLIRPPSNVNEVLCMAARRRHLQRAEFIDKLLTVIVADKLIDAIMDDGRGGQCTTNNARASTLPT